MPVVFRETQTCQNGADLRLNGVPIASLEFMLDDVVTVGNLRIFSRAVVHFGHAGGKVLHLLLHGAQLVEDRHALGENAAPGEREAILRQVACADAFSDADSPVVEGFQSAKNLQQRGFAGAVRTHQTNPVFGRNQPIGPFKQEFVAVTFSGGGKLDHEAETIVSYRVGPVVWSGQSCPLKPESVLAGQGTI